MEEQVKLIKSWLDRGSINIFGRPFAGKDTQGHKLAKILGGQLLGSGEILRASAPAILMTDTNAGKLFPTKEYIKFVTPYLKKPEFANKPLILSSVGRWHGEEAGVMEATAAAGHELKIVIYLEASEETVKARWQKSQASGGRGQRADDRHLEVRLKEFNDKTLPVIDFYRNKGLLIEVDSNRPPKRVTSDILAALAVLAG